MKKALITGSSGGIGREIARQLAQKGYTITMVARSEDKLKTEVRMLDGSGHSYLAADLTNPEELQFLIDHLKSHKYDLLVNNAGAGLYGKFIEMPLADQLASMKLNMDALVALSHGFLSTATKGDALVNIASLLGHSSMPGASVYAATKSFVAIFSESLWYEFKQKGIFVMGFNPGATNSEFHQHAGRATGDYPDFVVSKMEDVAQELIHALEKRKDPRVIQGWKNRMMLLGFKFLNRKLAISIMGKISPGMQ